MVDYYRKIERSVTISADKRSTVDLQVDVWSADANITKFILKLDTADSTAIDLTDATVTTALVYDGVILQDNGQVEEVATQRISYVLNERLRGYEGVVNGGFYVTLKTGQKIDIQNVSFNMRKSLIDTDLEPAKDSYYQIFEDIVYDVQSVGNTAKTQIGQVLPDVQSKVAAINNELAKIDENMPGLFVAYADNLSGGGFSKSDTTKLYKGYGVKNSTNPSDYRWERNVDSLQVGGRNLLLHSEVNESNMVYFEKQNATAEVVTEGSLKYYKIKINDGVSGNNNGIRIANNYGYYNLSKGKHYIFSYWIKVNVDYGFAFNSIGHHQVANWSDLHTEINNKYNVSSITANKWTKATIEFDTTVDAFFIPYIWFLEAGIEICVYGFMLEEGNTPSDWSPSPEDSILNSNPINSVLTTLSAENPSTTLGGTWTQLGTENKFEQTIYYWKRTN